MNLMRRSGVLLHPSALPGPFGSGPLAALPSTLSIFYPKPADLLAGAAAGSNWL